MILMEQLNEQLKQFSLLEYISIAVIMISLILLMILVLKNVFFPRRSTTGFAFWFFTGTGCLFLIIWYETLRVTLSENAVLNFIYPFILVFSLAIFIISAFKMLYGSSRSPSRHSERAQFERKKKLPSTPPREFRINDYLSLRLENNQTNIYVKGERFNQCKYLLLDIPRKKIQEVQEIKSIDEAAKTLNGDHERDKTLIPPEVEFWGHCSNLQAWYEHDYDLRLLHSNLGFPLLAKLADAGDPLARIAFNEEIALRVETGTFENIISLLDQDYFRHFTKSELDSLDFSDLGEKFRDYLQKNYQKNKKYSESDLI